MSQGPSTRAYPSLVAHALGLTMSVRPTNCHLVGDQLAISGAVADASDNTAPDTQCLRPPHQTRNLADEVAAAGLAAHPARLVLVQAGADDIDFAACLENDLVRVLGLDMGFGNTCVSNGTVTPEVAKKLVAVRTSLAATIEGLSPHTKAVGVLDYYQPIPEPAQIDDGSVHSHAGTNLVCTALKSNAGVTAAAAQVVLSALNGAIAGAVTDAEAHHVDNVRLIDVSRSHERARPVHRRPLGLLRSGHSRHDVQRRHRQGPGRERVYRNRRHSPQLVLRLTPVQCARSSQQPQALRLAGGASHRGWAACARPRHGAGAPPRR